MDNWILVGKKEPSEIQILLEQGREVGLRAVYVGDITFVIGKENEIFIKGEKVTELPKFVISAFIGEPGEYKFHVLNQLEQMGIACYNPTAALKKTRDKIFTSQVLAAKGIPVAKATIIKRGVDLNTILKNFEFPLIIKDIYGSKGSGVILVRDKKEIENILSLNDTELLLQEYIETSYGKDIRVNIVNDEIVRTVIRQNENDFRSNVSLGGKDHDIEATPEMEELVRKTAKALGLKIGGIDLLFGKEGYIVGEANSMPGMLRSEKGILLAKKYIDSIAKAVGLK